MHTSLAEYFTETLLTKPIKYKTAELKLSEIVSFSVEGLQNDEYSEDVFTQRDRYILDYLNILSRTNYTSGKILYVKPSAATKCPSILSTTVPTDSVSFIYIVGIGREIFSPPIATFSLEPLAKATESGEIYGEICLCRISKEKFTFAVLPCKHIGEEKV